MYVENVSFLLKYLWLQLFQCQLFFFIMVTLLFGNKDLLPVSILDYYKQYTFKKQCVTHYDMAFKQI